MSTSRNKNLVVFRARTWEGWENERCQTSDTQITHKWIGCAMRVWILANSFQYIHIDIQIDFNTYLNLCNSVITLTIIVFSFSSSSMGSFISTTTSNSLSLQFRVRFLSRARFIQFTWLVISILSIQYYRIKSIIWKLVVVVVVFMYLKCRKFWAHVFNLPKFNVSIY